MKENEESRIRMKEEYANGRIDNKGNSGLKNLITYNICGIDENVTLVFTEDYTL